MDNSLRRFFALHHHTPGGWAGANQFLCPDQKNIKKESVTQGWTTCAHKHQQRFTSLGVERFPYADATVPYVLQFQTNKNNKDMMI